MNTDRRKSLKFSWAPAFLWGLAALFIITGIVLVVTACVKQQMLPPCQALEKRCRTVDRSNSTHRFVCSYVFILKATDSDLECRSHLKMLE